MNEWSPEIEVTPELARELIGTQFPELTPVLVSLFGKGFDNTVFLVNQQYIFRFPRRAIAVQLLQTENKLLPQIEKELNIPIPVPVFLGQPCEAYPWPFSGYLSVPGVTPDGLSKKQRIEAAVPLAKFLLALHQFPIEKAEQSDVPFDELNRLSIEKRKEKLKDNVTKLINDGVFKDHIPITKYIEELQAVEPSSKLALVHGDLHIRNILVDEKGILSGIIDWGDVHIGNPAVDLSFVYSFLPPEGRREFFKVYGQVDETTKYLARFKAVFTSVLLLRYAQDLGDTGFLVAAMEALNITLA
jgi:aminoglycoside phosphotransferase (APT) family kinase protein